MINRITRIFSKTLFEHGITIYLPYTSLDKTLPFNEAIIFYYKWDTNI